MAVEVPQTRANHTRLDPGFHFVLTPILLVLVIWCLVHVIRHPSTEAVILLLLSAMVLLAAFKARQYAAKVQDRVIRLEERLRLASLSPSTGPMLCAQLTESQFVALRFASDVELPVLAERAVREKLSRKQIKEAIQNWRPDHWRV